MPKKSITIRLNEESRSVPEGITVGDLRDKEKPGADVLVVNGFPSGPDKVLRGGDQVVLIQRGEAPKADELEALMMARHTPNVHARMKVATVGIAGLGGLGSNVAIALARMGVGKLILADFDVVEPSNLNRQQYAIEHLGMLKTQACAQILEGINSSASAGRQQRSRCVSTSRHNSRVLRSRRGQGYADRNRDRVVAGDVPCGGVGPRRLRSEQFHTDSENGRASLYGGRSRDGCGTGPWADGPSGGYCGPSSGQSGGR
ncbi:ThiF family adenylyltransferase, partial [Thermodesulfobacteriota bacterium]